MLAGSEKTIRVKNRWFLRLALSSRHIYKVVLWLLGARSLIQFKYPKKRIDFFLDTFFADVDPGTGQMSKITWQRLFSNLAYIDDTDSNLFGIEFIKRSIVRMQSDKSLRKYFAEMTRNMLINEMHRESIPLEQRITFITVDVTQQCNMHCSHCFANSIHEHCEPLDTGKAIRFLKSAREQGGLRLISILGGEPLLEVDKIVEIAEAFPYTPIIVFTNGTLITDSLLTKVGSRYNIGLFVSVDGFSEITDAIRGGRSFELANSALECLKRNNLIYGASVTASKRNYREIVSLEFEKYLDSMGCNFVWIFDYKAIGRAGDDDELRNLIIEEAEQDYINRASAAINKRAGFLCINTEKGPSAIGGCPAHKGTSLHVSSAGYITPCVAVRYLREDINIADCSYLSALESNFLTSFREIGEGEGCPGRYYPDEFSKWKAEQRVSLIGHPSEQHDSNG